MFEWLTTALLAMLGFLAGFFYTRTMGLATRLPEVYMTKEDCRGFRTECRRGREQDRGELLERMDRIEAKLDRLTEGLLIAGGGERARHG